MPSLSPNKTIEGSIGGIVLAVSFVLIAINVLNLQFLDGIPLGQQIFIFATITIMSQIGDLFGSRLKRIYHVKDSGKLIPGHGGMLDRVDSHIFATITAFGFFLIYGVI